MTIYKFNKLTQDKKISTLELSGALVGSRREEGYRIYLFQLGSFYVELYYATQNVDLVKLLIFSSTRKLKPYLDKIDLEKLLSGI